MTELKAGLHPSSVFLPRPLRRQTPPLPLALSLGPPPTHPPHPPRLQPPLFLNPRPRSSSPPPSPFHPRARPPSSVCPSLPPPSRHRYNLHLSPPSIPTIETHTQPPTNTPPRPRTRTPLRAGRQAPLLRAEAQGAARPAAGPRTHAQRPRSARTHAHTHTAHTCVGGKLMRNEFVEQLTGQSW